MIDAPACAFDEISHRLNAGCIGRAVNAAAATHAEIKEMINPHLHLRDQDRIKSPDTFYERLTPL